MTWIAVRVVLFKTIVDIVFPNVLITCFRNRVIPVYNVNVFTTLIRYPNTIWLRLAYYDYYDFVHSYTSISLFSVLSNGGKNNVCNAYTLGDQVVKVVDWSLLCFGDRKTSVIKSTTRWQEKKKNYKIAYFNRYQPVTNSMCLARLARNMAIPMRSRCIVRSVVFRSFLVVFLTAFDLRFRLSLNHNNSTVISRITHLQIKNDMVIRSMACLTVLWSTTIADVRPRPHVIVIKLKCFKTFLPVRTYRVICIAVKFMV